MFKNKEEIVILINTLKLDKEFIKNNNLDNSNNSTNFKYLANGVFQAEGHIGGYFNNKKNLNFRPLVFIGLTANIESLKFFALLNNQLNFKMRYTIEKLSSGLFFVKLLSTD
jgi:hypothetical protein